MPNYGVENPKLPAEGNDLQVTLGVQERSFNRVLAHNRRIPVVQADPIQRSNARKAGSVKCEHLLMFPITWVLLTIASGQRAPHIQQEPPKLSQATGLKGAANQKSSFKDIRRVLALTEERVRKSIGASLSLGKVKQCLTDIQGESMERLESYPYMNPHTENEMDEEDEDCEDADKEHRSLTYMETVISRTIRYYGTSTLEKNPKIVNGTRRTHTRWGPVTEKEKILKDMHHEVTTASSCNSVDVVKLEKEAKQIDEELKKIIKMRGKTGVNLDEIEEHSEKRKKLRKAIQEARSLSLEEESKKSTRYKQGKGKGYTVIIQNLKSSLKNKN